VRAPPTLLAALERLADLHATLRAHRLPFQRTCHSVDLDRVNRASLLARLQVVRSRLLGAPDPRDRSARPDLSGAVLRAYTAEVIRPLLRGHRQMIHNSLSPLNVVLGPSPRFVDWETMALAAPEFDVAELLRFPGMGLTWPETDALVREVFEGEVDAERLRLATLTRALDYAGTNAKEYQRSQAEGDGAYGALVCARRTWYLEEARAIAAELGLAPLLGAILGESAGPEPGSGAG
jgi:hypothetical protein